MLEPGKPMIGHTMEMADENAKEVQVRRGRRGKGKRKGKGRKRKGKGKGAKEEEKGEKADGRKGMTRAS